jgi:hypothetical protein
MVMFDVFKGFGKIPIIGGLFKAGPGGYSAFEGWINGLMQMDQLEWMGMIAAGFAIVSIIAYSEILIRQILPQRRLIGYG